MKLKPSRMQSRKPVQLVSVMKKRITNIFVLKLIMQFEGSINRITERFLIGIMEWCPLRNNKLTNIFEKGNWIMISTHYASSLDSPQKLYTRKLKSRESTPDYRPVAISLWLLHAKPKHVMSSFAVAWAVIFRARLILRETGDCKQSGAPNEDIVQNHLT